MKSLLEYLITSLATFKDKVAIFEDKRGHTTTFTVTVDPQDIGKIIGKNGKTIKAIRTVLRIAAAASGSKVYVVLNEPNKAH